MVALSRFFAPGTLKPSSSMLWLLGTAETGRAVICFTGFEATAAASPSSSSLSQLLVRSFSILPTNKLSEKSLPSFCLNSSIYDFTAANYCSFSCLFLACSIKPFTTSSYCSITGVSPRILWMIGSNGCSAGLLRAICREARPIKFGLKQKTSSGILNCNIANISALSIFFK